MVATLFFFEDPFFFKSPATEPQQFHLQFFTYVCKLLNYIIINM